MRRFLILGLKSDKFCGVGYQDMELLNYKTRVHSSILIFSLSQEPCFLYLSATSPRKCGTRYNWTSALPYKQPRQTRLCAV